MTEPEEEDGGIDGPARRRRIGQERGHRRFAITRRTVPYWSVPRQASSAQPEALADDIEEALAGSDSQQRPHAIKEAAAGERRPTRRCRPRYWLRVPRMHNLQFKPSITVLIA